ncbi:MAG: hypothetical protein ACLPX5_00250 [Dissulfurispiraceae bacterium]
MVEFDMVPRLLKEFRRPRQSHRRDQWQLSCSQRRGFEQEGDKNLTKAGIGEVLT